MCVTREPARQDKRRSERRQSGGRQGDCTACSTTTTAVTYSVLAALRYLCYVYMTLLSEEPKRPYSLHGMFMIGRTCGKGTTAVVLLLFYSSIHPSYSTSSSSIIYSPCRFLSYHVFYFDYLWCHFTHDNIIDTYIHIYTCIHTAVVWGMLCTAICCLHAHNQTALC